jgi:phosphatidylglycerol:prolipoprotein diacylglycerol transferase
MKHTLFAVFGIDVPAYFGMLATGLALATWIGSRWVHKIGRDREVIIDLGLAATIWGVIGSRLLHVLADGYFWDYVHACTDPSLVDWHITREQCRSQFYDGVWDAAKNVCHPKERNCFAWAAFWAGGLTYYGGLIAAGTYAWFFLKREKFPFFKAADMAGLRDRARPRVGTHGVLFSRGAASDRCASGRGRRCFRSTRPRGTCT